jgi:GWxTD domain-containing protein
MFFSNILLAQKELGFELDFARFNYDTTSVYLEFYYELSPQNMKFTQVTNGIEIEAIVHFELKNTAVDTFFVNKDWKIHGVLTTNDSTRKTLTGAFGMVVPKGKYSLNVKAYDSKNPEVTRTITEMVTVQPFRNDKFSMSDIELASNIKKDDADQKSIFYKNTLEVIPNPSMVFSHQSPVLFYYAELYGLKLENADQTFNLQKLLYNSAGVQVYKNAKDVKQNPSAVVEYGIINLSKLPTDTYNLVFSLIDPKSKEAFITSKRFYLYNPNVKDTTTAKKLNTDVYSSEFQLMNVEECDQMFSEVKYIATNNEIKQYKALDSLSAKRTFLFNFWKGRDTDPSTERNEYKDDYMQRVEYANDHYTVGQKPGYLSDRGRVLLVYGEPDQRDFYPNESNLKPYETWYYNQIEGGVSFIFGDLTGFGNYILLHSTKRGEVNDSNWKDRLATQ